MRTFEITPRIHRPRLLLLSGALAVIASAAITLPASAAPGRAGSLDKSFNHVGYGTTGFGPNTSAFADGTVVSGDGTVLAVGDVADSSNNTAFALARYAKDGSLDSSFGSGGLVTSSYPGNTQNLATAAAYQGGKAVVVGLTSPDGGITSEFLLARYTKDGSLDMSFGTNGMTVTSFGGGQDIANAVAVQGDHIYVAGVTNPGSHNEFVLARYTRDGVLDSSFGTGGFVRTDFEGSRSEGNGIALQGDRILVGGEVHPGSHFVFAVARFTASGALDPSFGSGGWVTTDFGSDAFGLHLDARRDRILLLGQVDRTNHDFAAALYDTDGEAVAGFNGGTVDLPVGDGDATAFSGGLTEDGSVVAIGGADASGTSVFAVARWTKAGAPDPGFGTNGEGWVTTSIGSSAVAFAGGFGPDGRIVAVGFSDNAFAVARYLGK